MTPARAAAPPPGGPVARRRQRGTRRARPSAAGGGIAAPEHPAAAAPAADFTPRGARRRQLREDHHATAYANRSRPRRRRGHRAVRRRHARAHPDRVAVHLQRAHLPHLRAPVRELPRRGRHRPDVAADVPRGVPVDAVDPRGDPRPAHAPVEGGGRLRQLQQRPRAARPRDGHAAGVVGRRLPAGTAQPDAARTTAEHRLEHRRTDGRAAVAGAVSRSTPARPRRSATSCCPPTSGPTGRSAPSTSCPRAGPSCATFRCTSIRAERRGPPTPPTRDPGSRPGSRARSRSRCGGRASRSRCSTASAIPCPRGPTSWRGSSTRRPGSPRAWRSRTELSSDCISRTPTPARSSRRWSRPPPSRPDAS